MDNPNDLISRAAAIEICKSIVPNTNPDFYNLKSKAGYGSWMHSNGEVCTITNIETKIEALPAVDAAPVVHGRWIETTIPANTTGHGGVGQDKKKGRLCSNCKCAFDAVLLWCDSFCPNCGAKMDDERRNENATG